MERIVTCGETFSLFGPFTSLQWVEDFIEEHQKVCRRPHTIRKLTDPKFGVRDGKEFDERQQGNLSGMSLD